MKTQLKISGTLQLESNESQWRLLVNGLVDRLETSMLIRQDEKTVRIRLVITSIIPPEQRHVITNCLVRSDNDEDINQGMSRINTYLNQMIEKDTWLFTAHIISEVNVPILIAYYPMLDIFLYSQKKKNEKKEEFLPPYVQN